MTKRPPEETTESREIVKVICVVGVIAALISVNILPLIVAVGFATLAFIFSNTLRKDHDEFRATAFPWGNKKAKTSTIEERLNEVESLFDQGDISDEEYREHRNRILSEI